MKRALQFMAVPMATILAILLAAFVLLRGEPVVAAAPPSIQNPHGGFKQQCALCHSSADWKTIKLSSKFDHGAYGFPLEAAHASAACTSCHTTLDFTKAQTVCASCHTDSHRGEMGTDCARCHGSRSFTDRGPMVRAHQLGQFPLTGSHAVVDCAGCHKPAAQGKLQFVGTSTECRSCHEAEYVATRNPDHVTQGFPRDCRGCHSPQAWNTATFDHSRTAFPLTGTHRTQDCVSCHTGGDFKAADPACITCHATQYQSATPGHVAANFAPAQCATCHTTTAWSGAQFDHGTTSFALTGAHQSAACAGCHADNVFNNKPAACSSCHMTDYSAATPNHAASGFAAAQCATCHTTTTFAGATFNHATTQFPLTGSHQAASCTSCHGDGVYNGKPTACLSCHMTDYNAATPNHAASGFSAGACATCHTTTTFAGATFNHATTLFPLTGAHQAVSCNSCHSDGVYHGKATACVSCHNSDYTGAAPNHVAAGFASSQCATCHTTTAWTRGVFNHGATSFPLTGSHVAATCNSCHSDNVFNNKPTACSSCHMTDYNAATPNHAASGFSASACATCHTTTTFAGAVFNHATTLFPLTGAHQAVSCNSCHSDGVYHGKATACVSCHNSDYTGAAPNHVAAGFASSQCATCHTTTAWTRGVFNHGATSFPLTGSHVAATCNSCHSDNVFNNKPTACSSCHMTDYNGASPNHAASGFSASACATCHTTTTFAGAVFNHSVTLFPLTGSHLAVSCSSCHGDGVYAGKSTACYSCHLTDYNTAVPAHTQTAFPSNACATCHTTTTWSGATFNHATTLFPLTGAHISTTCNSCHSDGVYHGKSTACFSCHSTDWSGASPNHVAAGFQSSQCTTCHTTTTWAGAKMTSHDNSYFRIYSGKHNGRWSLDCTSCHTNTTNFTTFTCTSCHEHSSASTVNGHHNGVSGYTYTPTSCYTCHRNV